jgi:aerobic-type carbon monoxide dehydrogenase small subunit (CoxS/CutS family)
MSRPVPGTVAFTLNGRLETVPDEGASLLDVLRERLGVHSVKDGCSPQGQCGCCTVLVDGAPRVACVTPVARVAGRAVTTVEGLPGADRWAAAFAATGASQCGFCTPGIIVRLAAGRQPVDQALLAHLCRCTGWQTIREAAALSALSSLSVSRSLKVVRRPRTSVKRGDSERRAAIEGRTPQGVGPEIALGGGGFADDTAPDGALVAVRAADGGWVVAETAADARAASGRVPGRRSTVGLTWPVELPPGEWTRTVRTTWVEPAYLELDASWCAPGGEPASALANGGAFGGKLATEVGAVARRLADEHGRVVRVLLSREDVVRLGPKRPPLAAGVRADGTGVVRVVRTAGIAAAITAAAPGLTVDEVDVTGPPTSAAVRGAGWAEASVLMAALGAGPDRVCSPEGAVAEATVADAGVAVRIRAGAPLDPVVLRSYCIGAAHMALGWVRSEGIAVDADGEPRDLTIRSFGILRAVDMPPVEIEIEPDDGPPVNASDAVFAAVAAAAWRHEGFAPDWPVRRSGYRRSP